MSSKSRIGKAMIPAVAALALGAFVAVAQPKKDIGYDPHRRRTPRTSCCS
jgi:hypothetical protein